MWSDRAGRGKRSARVSAVTLAVAALTLLAGCAVGPVAPAEPQTELTVELPPSGAALDYQLGGAYAPDPATGIVGRDRDAAPEPGLYNICYINGFQTQPAEREL